MVRETPKTLGAKLSHGVGLGQGMLPRTFVAEYHGVVMLLSVSRPLQRSCSGTTYFVKEQADAICPLMLQGLVSIILDEVDHAV